jgi:MoaA/NifB/PqqE/SkfB family radical SAM enzyme
MLRNLLKLAQSDRHLHPRVVVYYVTGQCNLNCAYCEDFGARRNEDNQRPLPLKQVMNILGVIRTGSDALFLSGGEPFTHPDIDAIIQAAKQEFKFKELTLISNGSLLHQHEAVLGSLDRLVISLDCIDPLPLSQIIRSSLSTAQSILDNIHRYAAQQSKYGYRMIINTVLTPETLSTARSLLEFCLENHLLVSFSPQAVNNWPRYELAVSPDYSAFIQELLVLKHKGAPILGSDAYLQTLANFQPYDCYPALAPRIHPNGELSYPCRPLEKAENGQGGRDINLLDVQDWNEAWQLANQTYGQPPRNCHSCFQQCYAEPSLMQAQPLALLHEWLSYPASRTASVSTYSPG